MKKISKMKKIPKLKVSKPNNMINKEDHGEDNKKDFDNEKDIENERGIKNKNKRFRKKRLRISHS